jgi:hypothetical protein
MPRHKAPEAKPRSPAQLANDARLRTRGPKTKMDAMNVGPKTGMAQMAVGGDPKAEPKIEQTTVETVTDGVLAKQKKLEIEAFMNEPVTIRIHTTSEKNAEPVFPIRVNGREEFFARGQTKTVARRFVYGLAMARPTSYRNEEYRTADGSQSYRWPSSTGLRYGFEVVQDTPKGIAWLNEVLASPA